MSKGTADFDLIACVVANDAEVHTEFAEGEDFPGIGAGATVGPDGQPWVVVTICDQRGRPAVAMLNPQTCGLFMERMVTAVATCSSVGQSDATAH